MDKQKAFTVRSTTSGFQDSYVIAANVLNVSLASAATANGGTADGFVFHTTFGKLKVKTPALAFNPLSQGRHEDKGIDSPKGIKICLK